MADLGLTLFGIEFENPIWTAAGPAAADAKLLKQAAEGGAGALVTKTISISPARVPVPNIASPFAGSLLNAELWSEIDYRKFIEVELKEARKTGLPLIVSVGYTPEDLKQLGQALERSGLADALEFSIHYVGKDVENLKATARALKDNSTLPVLAKLSPAIPDLARVVGALDDIVDGFVAVNSLGPALDFDIETLKPALGSEDGRGWLSGGAILPVGLHYVAAISSLSGKPVIGVGGIRRVEDVVKYLLAGASAVQVCSLAILKGQEVYGRLAKDLSRWMDAHDYSSIAALKGRYLEARAAAAGVGQADLGQVYLGQDYFPHIDDDRCTYCLLCRRSCLHRSIEFRDKVFVLDRETCVSCGLCVSLCPEDALSMENG